MNVYAVIQSGGKQYRVSPGDVVRVDKLDATPGDTVEIDKVALLETGQETHIGRPVVEGALVRAQVLEQGRGEKILVFKMKRRKGYRRTAGHRQYFTALKISEISINGNVFREQVEKPKEVKNAQSPAAQSKKEAPSKPQKEKAKKKKTEKKAAPVVQQEKTQEKAVSTVTAERADPVKEIKEAESMPPPAAPVQAESAPPAQAVPSQTELPTDKAEEKPLAPEPEIPVEVPAAKQPLPQEKSKSADPAPVKTEPAPALASLTEDSPSPPARSAAQESAPAKPSKVNRRLVLAVAAALLLLAIILLLWGRNSFTPSQSAVVPEPGIEQPVSPEPTKAAPPVKEKITEDTAPLDKPSAPAQPPD